MATSTRDTTERDLQRELARARMGRRRGRVPDALRRRIVEFALEGRAGGRLAADVARAMGIHEVTLSQWTAALHRGAPSRGGFRQVRVIAESAVRVSPASVVRSHAGASEPPRLRVAHASTGIVIDGLDVDGVVALLRKLS